MRTICWSRETSSWVSTASAAAWASLAVSISGRSIANNSRRVKAKPPAARAPGRQPAGARSPLGSIVCENSRRDPRRPGWRAGDAWPMEANDGFGRHLRARLQGCPVLVGGRASVEGGGARAPGWPRGRDRRRRVLWSLGRARAAAPRCRGLGRGRRADRARGQLAQRRDGGGRPPDRPRRACARVWAWGGDRAPYGERAMIDLP